MKGTAVRPLWASTVLILMALSLRTDAQPRASNSFVVTNVRVFDGARVLEHTQVAVRDGRISAIGSEVDAANLPQIDGTDATVIPGLIDAHVHVRDAADLRQALAFGVTTVLDMGAEVDPRTLFALRTTAHSSADMADLRLAGFYANAPRGDRAPADIRIAVDIPPVATVADARAFVAARRAEGADYLKIVLHGVRTAASGQPNLDEPRVRTLVESAHSAGLKAVAHVENLDDVRIALAARIDGLMHVWREGGPNPEIARALVAQHVFVVPTLAVPDGLLPDGGRTALATDTRFGDLLSDRVVNQLRALAPAAAASGGSSSGAGLGSPQQATNANQIRRALADEIAAVRNLHDTGVAILCGSDAGFGSPTVQGISMYRELELLTKAGLTPQESLAAGTRRTAEAFHLADRGMIAPGRRADLLLVRGNPTSDILAVRSILRVWKEGHSVDRTAFLH